MTRAIPAVLVLALALLSGAAASAATPADPTYCVEKDAAYVAGQQVHPDVRRCVPGP